MYYNIDKIKKIEPKLYKIEESRKTYIKNIKNPKKTQKIITINFKLIEYKIVHNQYIIKMQGKIMN